MKNKFLYFVTAVVLFMLSCDGSHETGTQTTEFNQRDYYRDFPAIRKDGLVHVVVEIPAGSNEKWEVNKKNGQLMWERRDDSLRVVRYQPYPANYGMIPRTWLPSELGGDNDPLDVFLMGVSVPRGSVIPARVIGVIMMLDNHEMDYKLIAVPGDGWYSNTHTLADYQAIFPGTIEILEVWLSNYKGPGLAEIQGVGDEHTAQEILLNAIEAYQNDNERMISE